MGKEKPDRIEVKIERSIPGNIRLFILILNIVISSEGFTLDISVSSLLFMVLYTLPGIIIFFASKKIIINPENIFKETNLIFFKYKSKFPIEKFHYVYFTSKNKTYSSTGGLRPTGQEFYSINSTEIFLYNKDLKTKELLGNLTNREDAQKVIKLLTENYGLELYIKK